MNGGSPGRAGRWAFRSGLRPSLQAQRPELNYKDNSFNLFLPLRVYFYECSKLKNILNVKYGVFRNIQNIRSEESVLMQLADFLMGAISYNANFDQKQNFAKVLILDKISKHANMTNLAKTNYSEKLNLFFIDLK